MNTRKRKSFDVPFTNGQCTPKKSSSDVSLGQPVMEDEYDMLSQESDFGSDGSLSRSVQSVVQKMEEYGLTEAAKIFKGNVTRSYITS